MPCAALRLNIIKLNVGSVITFHEPSKVDSQSINTLQFLFQVISECNKDLRKEIHQAQLSPHEFLCLGVSQECVLLIEI